MEHTKKFPAEKVDHLHANLEYLGMEFGGSEKISESWDPQKPGTFFSFVIFHFYVLQTGMQSESNSFQQALQGSV